MLLILGLLGGIAGFVLLVVGGFAAPGRARISHVAARSSGVFFLAFLPLVFLTKYLNEHFAWNLDADATAIINWVLLSLCGIAGLFILLRALWKAPRVRRRSTRTPAQPTKATESAPTPAFDTAPASAAKPKPRAVKKQIPEQTENPFDFS